jgi:hypothetical protein
VLWRDQQAVRFSVNCGEEAQQCVCARTVLGTGQTRVQIARVDTSTFSTNESFKVARCARLDPVSASLRRTAGHRWAAWAPQVGEKLRIV